MGGDLAALTRPGLKAQPQRGQEAFVEQLQAFMSSSEQSGSMLTVAMYPAWKGLNAYTGMLADSLQAQGLKVSEMSVSLKNYPFRSNVVILHWPNEFFIVAGLRYFIRATILLLIMTLARWIHDQKIVWVVHNIAPHAESGSTKSLLRRFFFKQLRGLIFLSPSSRRTLLDAYPELATMPFVVIRHGHYLDRALKAPSAMPSVSPDRVVRLSFVGQIRGYKSPDVLLRLASELPDKVHVTCAGHCPEPELESTLRAIAQGARNIELKFGFVSDDAMEQNVDEADAVVLPYGNILNSGSAIYALSRYRPVLVPRMGSLIELQSDVGAEWVYLYEGTLSRAILEDFVRWVRDVPRDRPDLSAHDWGEIGRNAARFLRDLSNRDARHGHKTAA